MPSFLFTSLAALSLPWILASSISAFSTNQCTLERDCMLDLSLECPMLFQLLVAVISYSHSIEPNFLAREMQRIDSGSHVVSDKECSSTNSILLFAEACLDRADGSCESTANQLGLCTILEPSKCLDMPLSMRRQITHPLERTRFGILLVEIIEENKVADQS